MREEVLNGLEMIGGKVKLPLSFDESTEALNSEIPK